MASSNRSGDAAAPAPSSFGITASSSWKNSCGPSVRVTLNLFPSITSGAGRMVISVVRRTPSRPRRSKTSPPSRGPRSDMSGSWESSRYARTANMSRNAASKSSSTATMTGCAAALRTPTRARRRSADGPALEEVGLGLLEHERLLLHDALGAGLVESLYLTDERRDPTVVEGKERAGEALGVVAILGCGDDLVDRFRPNASIDRFRVARRGRLRRDVAARGRREHLVP